MAQCVCVCGRTICPESKVQCSESWSRTIEACRGDLWILDTSLHRINIVLKAFESVLLNALN